MVKLQTRIEVFALVMIVIGIIFASSAMATACTSSHINQAGAVYVTSINNDYVCSLAVVGCAAATVCTAGVCGGPTGMIVAKVICGSSSAFCGTGMALGANCNGKFTWDIYVPIPLIGQSVLGRCACV